MSSEAKAYIRREARYLRLRSQSGAKKFSDIVKRAKLLVSDYPHSGQTDSAIPLIGAQRAIIDGYHFDYDLIDGEVWIQNVKSSVNTPHVAVENNHDYEAAEDPEPPQGPGRK